MSLAPSLNENHIIPTSQHTARLDHTDQSLLTRLIETRRLSMQLAAPLSDEDQVVQAMDDASPTKWHLAHTTWFFEAFILSKYLDNYQRFNDKYEYCFNSYYEAVGPRHPRPKRGVLTRPSVADVRAYRAHVDDDLDSLNEQYKNDLPEELVNFIELGINHEQQHQELLLTDILSLFAANPLYPSYCETDKPEESISEVQPVIWQSFDGGLVDIGHNKTGFCYDNEGPAHEHYLAPFKIANRLVTNAEWIEFIDDGGYTCVEYWLSDGWAKVREEQWIAPLYWQQKDGVWWQMSLHGLRPVVHNQPVHHISYYEAAAFANWAGKRLPTEQEWEHASYNANGTANTLQSNTFKPMKPMKPMKANAQDGLLQMFGDVWEWTQSAYAPYPGYKSAVGAIGEYNGKFMCNQYVLRGGSCVTSQDHIRHTYRNFFYPFQRWQYTGLRLACDDA